MSKVIGVTGQHGRLGRILVEHGCVPIECDVTIGDDIEYVISNIRPDTIIHCASVTDVDRAELELLEAANRVNAFGTHVLRRRFGGQIIYMSTDFVFDGKRGPYSESAIPNPINNYGRTKLRGENCIKIPNFPNDVIVRTTILYGGNKPDFVTSVLDHFKKNEQFTIPHSLVGSPTYVYHLAEALMKVCELESPPKILNIVGSDVISRYEFALMIATVWGLNKELIVPSNRVPGIANRPKKVGLTTNLAKKYGIPIYTTIDGLQDMKKRMEEKRDSNNNAVS